MKLSTIVLATALLTAGTVAASAQGWNRQSSTTGPYGGTVSSQGSGSCVGGSCSSQQSATGVRGNTVTRSGSTSCSGGSCKGSATYTGPAGRTATRTRSFTRN